MKTEVQRIRQTLPTIFKNTGQGGCKHVALSSAPLGYEQPEVFRSFFSLFFVVNFSSNDIHTYGFHIFVCKPKLGESANLAYL